MAESPRFPHVVALPSPPRRSEDVIVWAQQHSTSVANAIRRIATELSQFEGGGIALPTHATTHKLVTGTDAIASSAPATSQSFIDTATIGSSENVPRADHGHVFTAEAHSGVYAAAATAGSNPANFIRHNAIFAFPQALKTDSGDTLTLSDDGTDNNLTSSITDGLLDLILSRGDAAVTAARINWNVGVAAPTDYGQIAQVGWTDNVSAFQSVGRFYPVYKRSGSGTGGRGFLVDHVAGTAGFLGFRDSSTENQFSGWEMSNNTLKGFFKSTSILSMASAGPIFGGSGTAVLMRTDTPKDLSIQPAGTYASGSSLVRVIPHFVGAPGWPTDAYLFSVYDNQTGAGELKFAIRGIRVGDATSSRGAYLAGGDYTAAEAQFGTVVYDGAKYYRSYVTANGCPVIEDIGAVVP